MIQFLGLGACGSRIALQIEELAPRYNVDPRTTYINFDEVDMKELDRVEKKRKLLLEGSGTGRHPAKGEELAKKNKKQLTDFLQRKLKRDDMVFVLFGAGGGTGSGLAPVVIEILSKMGYQVGVAMTFPDHKSDIVVNQNAIYTLNKIMEISDNIKPMILIDNDYLISNLKNDPTNWWGKVNSYIGAAFLNIQTMFNVGEDRVSTHKGISNLDLGELKRTFYVDGLTDIKMLSIPQQSIHQEDFIERFKEAIAKESLTGKFKMKDTLAYACNIIVGEEFRALDKCNEMFDAIAEMTPNSAIRRIGTMYQQSVRQSDTANVEYVKVILISAGYKLPNEINKKIKDIKKNTQKFLKAKAKESKVDLKEGLDSSIGVGDDFVL